MEEQSFGAKTLNSNFAKITELNRRIKEPWIGAASGSSRVWDKIREKLEKELFSIIYFKKKELDKGLVEIGKYGDSIFASMSRDW